jgi:hypothetical protein
MKHLLDNYVFNPGLQQISFPTSLNLLPNGFLLITNLQSNTIIFNFANTSQTGSLSSGGNSNVLQLNYNTASMNYSDPLAIWYDDGTSPTNNVETLLMETNIRLGVLVDTNDRIRKGIDMLINILDT